MISLKYIQYHDLLSQLGDSLRSIWAYVSKTTACYTKLLLKLNVVFKTDM